MKTLLKLLMGLVLLSVVLVGAAFAALTIFFDPNEYKPEIESLALEHGNVEVKIDGDIGWSVYPWLGLEINQVAVSFPNQPQVAALKQAQVSVSIPDLLSGQVKMKRLLIDGLDANLVQTAQGNNWTPPASSSESSESASSSTSNESSEESSKGSPVSIDIESIAFTNGNLSYDDQVAGSRALIENLNLTTGNLAPEKAFPIELSLTVKQFANGSNTPSLTADVALESQARFNLDTLTVWLNQLAANTKLSGDAFPKPIEVTLGGNLVASPAQLLINNLQFGLANLKADGNLDVRNFAAPVIKGDLTVGAFALNELLAALGQAPVETSDVTVLKNISAELTLDGTANMISVPSLTLRLDDTRFTGDAAYALNTGAIIANISGDSIDADRYLPPASDTAPEAQAPSATTGDQPLYSKEDVIPVDVIKSLNLDTTFKLGNLRINKLDMQDVDLAVTAEKGVLNAKRINLDMYDGQIRNSVVVNANKTPATLAINKSIKGVEIGKMLKAMADTDMLSGAINSTAKLTAKGTSVHDIVHSLNGTTSTTMDEGVLNGIDMAYTVCQGLNTVGSLGINTQEVDQSTPFANLRANTKIVNGVVTNPDLKASLDAMILTGDGNVNLPSESFRYDIGLVIESNLFNKTCKIPDFIEGVKLPVICKGGFFDDPIGMCRPNISGFTDIYKEQAEAELNAKLKEEREKAKAKFIEEREKAKAQVEEKVTEKLGDEAKTLIKGLFGR